MGAALAPAPTAWEFPAIGTRWRIDTEAPLAAETRDRIDARIAQFDAAWSRFRSDSTVARLAAQADAETTTADGGGRAVVAPPDAAAMLDWYVELSDATAGALNPLVGASLAHRGYDAQYSLRDRGALPAPAAWRDAVTWEDGMLRLTRPALLDVGAVGKGRLVDLVASVIDETFGGSFVVDASGDLVVRGMTERIALEHPFRPGTAIGVWEVSEGALCASATGRRAWPGIDGVGLHHVLDARTGEPVRTVAATWAVAADALTADGIASALFFDGAEPLAAQRGAEWVRMYSDGRVDWSRGARAELFV